MMASAHTYEIVELGINNPKEVKKDMDCGITLEKCQDYKEKDIIEIYELVEIKR